MKSGLIPLRLKELVGGREAMENYLLAPSRNKTQSVYFRINKRLRRERILFTVIEIYSTFLR
jgi:hypothetical protein